MDSKKVYTVTESAQVLKVSRQTIYKWIKTEKIIAHKLPSGKIRIPASEIEKYWK